MLRKGFLRFHQAAEAAGYPALLVVTIVALGTIVSGILLVGIMKSVWALAFALTCLAASIALVAAAMEAMFSDVEEPADDQLGAEFAAPASETVLPLPRAGVRDPQQGSDRRAA